MAALNSLPVIEYESAKVPKERTDVLIPKDNNILASMLMEMGYDKFIVAKSISLFGNDEDKCIGK
jgi:hypothetical protein